MTKFWWDDQIDARKIHWISWERLFWPKEARGLSFKDLYTFNLAMLAKQGWRLMHNSNTLVARILKTNIYLMMIFFMPKQIVIPLLRGIASWKELKCSNWVVYGEWEIICKSRSGRTLGFQMY